MSFPHLIHVALTVGDLDASVAWYSRLFGEPPALEQDEGSFRSAVWVEPLLGLHEHSDGLAGEFNERRPGLDHVAFGVDDRDELETWVSRLDELGIEHGGIVDVWYGSGLSFRDNNNIALELFCSARSK